MKNTNWKNVRWISLLIIMLVSLSALAACGSGDTATPVAGDVTGNATAEPASGEATETPLKEPEMPSPPPVSGIDVENLLEERCTGCHTMNRITSAGETTEGWTVIVDRMIQKGAMLDEQERTLLIEHLAENYQP